MKITIKKSCRGTGQGGKLSGTCPVQAPFLVPFSAAWASSQGHEKQGTNRLYFIYIWRFFDRITQSSTNKQKKTFLKKIILHWYKLNFGIFVYFVKWMKLMYTFILKYLKSKKFHVSWIFWVFCQKHCESSLWTLMLYFGAPYCVDI